MGRSIRKDKKPSGPKSMFASKIKPINQAESVAVTKTRYMARFPFRLNIKVTINIRNTKNSRIVKTNPSIPVPPVSLFYYEKQYITWLLINPPFIVCPVQRKSRDRLQPLSACFCSSSVCTAAFTCSVQRLLIAFKFEKAHSKKPPR